MSNVVYNLQEENFYLANASPYNTNSNTIADVTQFVSNSINSSVYLPETTFASLFYLINQQSSTTAFYVKNLNGSPIKEVAPGTAHVVFPDPEQEDKWLCFLVATESVTQINAAGLQGYGLEAFGAALNTVTSNVFYVTDDTSYTISSKDQSALIVFQNSQINTVSLSQSYSKGFTFTIHNNGSGIVNIVPNVNSLIKGKTSLSIYPEGYVTVVFDGVNWTPSNFTPINNFVNGVINIDLANCQGQLILNSNQLSAKVLNFYSSSLSLQTPVQIYFDTVVTDNWLITNNITTTTVSCCGGTPSLPLGSFLTMPQNLATFVYGSTLNGVYSLYAPIINATGLGNFLVNAVSSDTYIQTSVSNGVASFSLNPNVIESQTIKNISSLNVVGQGLVNGATSYQNPPITSITTTQPNVVDVSSSLNTADGSQVFNINILTNPVTNITTRTPNVVQITTTTNPNNNTQTCNIDVVAITPPGTPSPPYVGWQFLGSFEGTQGIIGDGISTSFNQFYPNPVITSANVQSVYVDVFTTLSLNSPTETFAPWDAYYAWGFAAYISGVYGVYINFDLPVSGLPAASLYYNVWLVA